jgi:hypothetical protein
MPRAILVALALAALALPAGSSASVTNHGNPAQTPDPIGDSGTAPDISSVLIGNNLARTIRFEITIANRTTLIQDSDLIAVFVDVDRNGTTDYEIHAFGNTGLEMVRPTASGAERVAAPSLARIWDTTGKLTIRVSSADLGNASSFDYYVGTGVLSGGTAAIQDYAPDGNVVFVYELSTPHIDGVAPLLSAKPRAGKKFRVAGASVHFETNEESRAESVRCSAKLAGKALRGTGNGGCTFALPRSAKGKRLSLTITATFQGQSATITSSLRVR